MALEREALGNKDVKASAYLDSFSLLLSCRGRLRQQALHTYASQTHYMTTS